MNNLKKKHDLSAQLDRITTELDESDRVEEKNRRTSLLSVLKNYMTSRFRFGQALASYKEVCRVEGVWLAASKAIGREIGRSQRTVFRILADYQRVADTPEPVLAAMKREGYDPAALKNEALLNGVTTATAPDSTPQQVRRVVRNTAARLKQANTKARSSDAGNTTSEDEIVRGLRQDIRKWLSNIPDNDHKCDLLEQSIAEESFEVWGDQDPWGFDITPRPGARALDDQQHRPREIAA